MDKNLESPIKQALIERWEPVYRSQLHYLVTWSTRGRRPVLKDRHTETLRRLVRETCEDRGFSLVEIVCGDDHVHLILGLRPTQSVASAVRELKGRTTLELLSQFPELRVWLRGNLLWDERYAVETVSPLRVDKLRERLAGAHQALLERAHPEGWAAAS